MPALLGWTGMRGVVSLAAALAIPVTLEAYNSRDVIIPKGHCAALVFLTSGFISCHVVTKNLDRLENSNKKTFL